MPLTPTTKLLLRKPDPDPSTGDFVNATTDLNENWDKVDAAVGTFICTSGTRPTGSQRWDGREIFETDTLRRYMWSNSLAIWVPLLISRGSNGPYLLGTSTDTGGEGFNFSGSAATADFLRLRVGSEANPRFVLDADGTMGWGAGGASAVDTFLSRTAANEISTGTGDALKVSGDFVAGSENGISVLAVSSGTDTTTSATYVNLAGTGATTSFSFVKRFAGTRIRIDFSATFYTTNVATGPSFAVLLNGTDYEVARLKGAAVLANSRLHTSGFRYIPSGIAAGTYTVQGRWRALDAGGTLTRDVNDWLCISARECN